MRIEIQYHEGYGAHSSTEGLVNPCIIENPYKYEFWWMTNYLRVYSNRIGYREFGLNAIKAVYVDGERVYHKDYVTSELYT